MGQAVGTAAAIAIAKGLSPDGMQNHIQELQQTLIRDDAYLPRVSQVFSDVVIGATLSASHGDSEPVRDGVNRPVGDDAHCWRYRTGDWIAYEVPMAMHVTHVTFILDSGLDQNVAMSYLQKDDQLTSPPDVMPKAFRIEGLIGDQWRELVRVDRNHQRLCSFAVDRDLNGIRFVLEETWGAKETRLYAFYVD